MLTAVILYSLYAFFVFHLLVNSDITALPREWVLARLPALLAYSVTCAFCATSWCTLALAACDLVPFYYVLAAPPVTMLLNLVYQRLAPPNDTTSQ